MFLQHLFGQSTKPSEPVGKRLVLAELRSALSAQFANADGLDSKLKQLLSSASLILSVVTTLQIATSAKQIGWLYLVGLSLAFILYAVLIIVILRALRPMTYLAPIPPRWEEIAQSYFDKDEPDALSLLISTYLEALDRNEAPITSKSNAVNLASILLVLIVAALLLMGLLGLGGNITTAIP